MKRMFIFGLLLALILLGGCTNDINSAVKAVPSIHKYLVEHPNSTLKITYWSSNITGKNIEIIQKQCGKQMQIKPYWFVQIESSKDIKMIAYLDAVTNNPECIVEAKAGEDLTPLSEIAGAGNNQVVNKPAETSQSVKTSPNAVKAQLYVMSHCPFGTQAENSFLPVVKKFNGDVDLDLEFIGDNDNGLSSMHGQKEVQEDIVQVCALNQDKYKAYDFILCRNKNLNSDWNDCAKQSGLDVSSLKKCAEGSEGEKLLSESFDKSKKAGASGSPTIIINGNPYSGSRTQNAFTRALCNAFKDNKPAICNNLPEPKKVNLIVLNDKRCKTCKVDQLVSSLKSLFPGLTVTNYDYGDAEGKALYKKTGITYLPALLFDDSVKEADAYSRISRYLVKQGNYLSLRIGAKFDPTKEICDNYKDDTGNGLVDCEDPDCEGALVCRKEIPKKLDLFIMADCPYGKMAVLSTKQLVENFGKNMNLSIHYIASENNGTFNSLHGPYEAEEDMRQLCVNKYYPDKALSYIQCRSNGSVRTDDYHKCLDKYGLDASKIDTCVNGNEGKQLMSNDIKIARQLDISASPTWLANNKYKFSGIDAETVKAQFCSHNKGLQGCNNSLKSNTKAPAGACG